MGTIWLDGFDTYPVNNQIDTFMGAGNYAVVNGPIRSFTANARTGPGCARLSGGSNFGLIFPNVTTIAVGSAWYPILNTQREICMSVGNDFDNGNIADPDAGFAGNGFKLIKAANSNISLIQYTVDIAPPHHSVETLLYTTTNSPLPLDAYTYLELKVDQGAGTAEVWKNGNVKLFDVSGIVYTGGFDNSFMSMANAITGQAGYIDDYYVTDGNLLGAQRCYTLFVNEDKTPQDWSYSTGASGFSLIDNPDYHLADYIEANVINDIARFGCDNLPMTTAVINSMRLVSVQALADAGSALDVQSAFIGASTYDGSPKSPSTSPVYYNDIFDLGSSSVADINAMEIQIKKTA